VRRKNGTNSFRPVEGVTAEVGVVRDEETIKYNSSKNEEEIIVERGK